MNKNSSIPSAWDDDWEVQADKNSEAEQGNTFSKAERLAKHDEINRKIWKSAEEPETFHFLAARDNVPLKSEFKPALKVLSRKPAPMMIEQIDPFTGNKKLKQEDDKNDIEQNDQLTHGQLKLKAQKEREEKQKRYDEARARILGVPSTSSPGENTGHKYLNPDGSKLSQTNRRWGTNVRDIAYDGLRLVDSNQILNARHEYMARKKNTESSQSSLRDDCNISRKPRGPDANGKPGFNFNKKASK